MESPNLTIKPDVVIKPDERIDDLQCRGYQIIQNSGMFCFGMDAVLLANYVRFKRKGRYLDLGTGTGIIPILLAASYLFAVPSYVANSCSVYTPGPL